MSLLEICDMKEVAISIQWRTRSPDRLNFCDDSKSLKFIFLKKDPDTIYIISENANSLNWKFNFEVQLCITLYN